MKLYDLLQALCEHVGRIDGIAKADIWDGGWHALEDPKRVSLTTPAGLVALTAFEDVHRAQSRFHPRQLRRRGRGRPRP